MKIKILFSILFVLYFSANNYAQNLHSVQGTISDSIGPLPGIIVKLISSKDSLKTVTNANGVFVFSEVQSATIKLTASLIGYQTFTKDYTLDKPNVILPLIKIKPSMNQLDEVVVQGITPVKVMEDTVQYDARAYKVKDGDAVEEIIKKLPGVTVDKDGNVTVQGKPITAVRVNGKDFFGGDVANAIQNLPADIIQNLQIVDDYGEKAKITKIKNGEPQKILNINIQPDKKRGYFARANGGMGNEDRFISNVKANKFVGERQLSFNGSINNTNTRGGGGDGFTNSKYIGLNYKDEFGKKLVVYGDYRYSTRDNNTLRSIYRQNFFSSGTQIDDIDNSNSNRNYEHHFTWNVEYKIDTLNYIKITPDFDLDGSSSSYTGLNNSFTSRLKTVSDNKSSTTSQSPHAGLRAFYNHKFKKNGRNFSVNTNVDFSNSENERDVRNNFINRDSLDQLLNTQNQYQLVGHENGNNRAGLDLSYMEPLGKNSFLELNYNLDLIGNKNIRNINEIDPQTQQQLRVDSLSNNFQYNFRNNRGNLNYRIEREKLGFRIGLTAQTVTLFGDDITRGNHTNKTFFNWIPNGRFVYRFTKTKIFTSNFDSWSNQPNFYQIQPITDNSNIRNIVVGNADLKPEFTNKVNMEYKQSDYESGNLLFTNISFTRTSDKIVSGRNRIFTLDSAGSPTNIINRTGYLNTDGFYSWNGYYSYSKPFAGKKFTLTYEGGTNYSNNVSFIDNERNLGKNLGISQGLKFRTDIEDIIDTELRTRYSVDNVNYSIPSFTDRKVSRLVFSLEGRNYFFNDTWTLGYDFSKTINKGYNNPVNPNILSVYVEHRFLNKKRANIRLQGFDLFNENTGISRNVYDTVIEDMQTNRLARYFLLSFNYRIQNFGGK